MRLLSSLSVYVILSLFLGQFVFTERALSKTILIDTTFDASMRCSGITNNNADNQRISGLIKSGQFELIKPLNSNNNYNSFFITVNANGDLKFQHTVETLGSRPENINDFIANSKLSVNQKNISIDGYQQERGGKLKENCNVVIDFEKAPIQVAENLASTKPAIDKSAADNNVQRNDNKKIPVLIKKYCNQSPSVKEYTAFSFYRNGLFENDHFDFSKQLKNAQGLDQIEKYNLDLDNANKLRWKEYVLIQGNSPYNKTSEGRLKSNQTNIKLEKVEDDGRVCGADITFDQAPIIDRPDPELEKVKNELAELKAQVAASKTKIDTTADLTAQTADDLKPLDDQVTKLKLSSDKLALQFDGYKQLQDQVKSSFEDKLSLSIKNVETQIAGLSSAKDAAVNAEQIKQLQASLSDLKSKKLADDPTFQSITQKLAAAKKEAADNDAALKAQIDGNKQKLDAQRLSDMIALEEKLGGLSNQMAAYQSKFDADLAAYQSTNNQRFSQISANIDNLNARTAELEKNQKTLANNQATLAVKQANTDARLDGIFLPKSENPPDWISRLSSIPVQQNQFCRIVDRFYDDLANVYKLRNDIKKNALYKDRQQDMAALLPNGAINSWIVRVVEVTQAADGSAAIMLQPPCRAMLGSDACGTDQKKFRATIQPDTLMYRELARVNSGDFVTVSGTILYAQTMNTSSALPQYALYEPNKHCSAADGSKEEDVFVTEITNIAVLR